MLHNSHSVWDQDRDTVQAAWEDPESPLWALPPTLDTQTSGRGVPSSWAARGKTTFSATLLTPICSFPEEHLLHSIVLCSDEWVILQEASVIEQFQYTRHYVLTVYYLIFEISMKQVHF